MLDNNLKNRARWAINYVCQRDKLTNKSLSNLLKINTSNISQYRAKRIRPSAEFMKEFCNYFSFNEAWFLSGQGEPFWGARKKYEEICGPVESGVVSETIASYSPATKKINIDEVQGKVFRILSADTALSAALYMTIQQFAEALDTGHALQKCQEQIGCLQTQINELKQQMDRLMVVPTITKGQGDD
jgi:hypothetical protein